MHQADPRNPSLFQPRNNFKSFSNKCFFGGALQEIRGPIKESDSILKIFLRVSTLAVLEILSSGPKMWSLKILAVNSWMSAIRSPQFPKNDPWVVPLKQKKEMLKSGRLTMDRSNSKTGLKIPLAPKWHSINWWNIVKEPSYIIDHMEKMSFLSYFEKISRVPSKKTFTLWTKFWKKRKILRHVGKWKKS